MKSSLELRTETTLVVTGSRPSPRRHEPAPVSGVLLRTGRQLGAQLYGESVGAGGNVVKLTVRILMNVKHTEQSHAWGLARSSSARYPGGLEAVP